MNHLNYHENQLYFDDVPINELVNDYPTPFYLYSETAILENYKNFYSAAIRNKIQNPLVCFALKANPNPYLLESLFRAGAGADIVSGGELQRALQAGCSPDKIVFSGVGKTREEIEFAIKCSPQGIYSFNVESEDELIMINDVARANNCIARVAIRLNPKVNAKTHKYISTGYKTHKFGILKDDVFKLMGNIQHMNHIKLCGLSIHIGSQLIDLKATKKAIQEICTLANTLNIELEFLDLGGGLGVDYKKKNNTPSADKYMAEVFESLAEHLTVPIPRILFEPGRFICASAGIFITKVIRTKMSEKTYFAIVDGGMNDFVRTSLYGAYHEIIPIKVNEEKKIPTEIVGPICETSDMFASKFKIQKLKAEDYIAVLDVGAYGHSMSSTYNLRKRPKELTLSTHGEIIIHEY